MTQKKLYIIRHKATGDEWKTRKGKSRWFSKAAAANAWNNAYSGPGLPFWYAQNLESLYGERIFQQYGDSPRVKPSFKDQATFEIVELATMESTGAQHAEAAMELIQELADAAVRNDYGFSISSDALIQRVFSLAEAIRNN